MKHNEFYPQIGDAEWKEKNKVIYYGEANSPTAEMNPLLIIFPILFSFSLLFSAFAAWGISETTIHLWQFIIDICCDDNIIFKIYSILTLRQHILFCFLWLLVDNLYFL
jgi:hypothetical protein